LYIEEVDSVEEVCSAPMPVVTPLLSSHSSTVLARRSLIVIISIIL